MEPTNHPVRLNRKIIFHAASFGNLFHHQPSGWSHKKMVRSLLRGNAENFREIQVGEMLLVLTLW